MCKKNLPPIKETLSNGAEVIYAIPTGGYGHAADEQPLPYIRHNGKSITPRFGGDEESAESSYYSLPLPVGRLMEWPLSQSAFNFFRRRVNIYWRNIFCSFNSYKPEFMFARQLNFRKTRNGFVGNGPLVKFTRKFHFDESSVVVIDRILFRKPLRYEFFEYAHHAIFCNQNSDLCVIADVIPNVSRKNSSSTGEFVLYSHRLENVKFNKGDVLTSKVVYGFT